MRLIPESEVEITISRSGGPGGQHVNKTNSRVTLRWNLLKSQVLTEEQKQRCLERLQARLTQLGELVLHVDTFRSQIMNRDRAFERLNEIVNQALVIPKKRLKTKASRASKARRLDYKKKQGDKKKMRKNDF